MSEKATTELKRSLRSSSNLQTKVVRQSAGEASKSSATKSKSKSTIAEKENFEQTPRTSKSNRTLTATASNANEICLDSDTSEASESSKKSMKKVEKKRKQSKKVTKENPDDNLDIIILDSDSEQPTTIKAKVTPSNKRVEASSNSEMGHKSSDNKELRASKRKVVELEADTSANMEETSEKFRKTMSTVEPSVRKSTRLTSQVLPQNDQRSINPTNTNMDEIVTNIDTNALENRSFLLRSSSRLVAKESPSLAATELIKPCILENDRAIQYCRKSTGPRKGVNTGKEEKACGLCGAENNLIKTECCNNYVCDDLSNFEMFSLTHDSCFRNHKR